MNTLLCNRSPTSPASRAAYSPDSPVSTASPCEAAVLRDYRRHAEVEAHWLFEQYVYRRRTLRDLAREKGMSPARMNRWAKSHTVPLRRGEASHSATLRAAERATQAPAFLREALTSAYAWERLERSHSGAAHGPGV